MANDIELVIRMLPWLVQHQGKSASEIAAHFGIRESHVLDLLNLLVFTGAHQYGGGLVDIELDDAEFIFVREAQSLDRPVRLSRLEATTIVGGLTYLQQIGTVAGADQVEDLLLKIRGLLNDVAAPLDIVTTPVDPQVVALVNEAINSHVCLDIEYGSAGTHEVSKRTIEPVRVDTQDDRSYIVAWCREAEGMRSFRFDRIHHIARNPDPQQQNIPREREAGDYAHTAVVLVEAGVLGEVDPASIVGSETHSDGRLRLTLEVGRLEWLARVIVASGGQVEAYEPAELLDLVTQMLQSSNY